MASNPEVGLSWTRRPAIMATKTVTQSNPKPEPKAKYDSNKEEYYLAAVRLVPNMDEFLAFEHAE